MDTYPEPLLGPRPASWESAPSHQSLNPHHRQRVMVTSSTPRKEPAAEWRGVLLPVADAFGGERAPAIVVTLFTAMAAARVLVSAPPISKSASAFVRIEQSPTSPPRPPLLPTGRSNSTISTHVSEATRWAKLAWLIECQRVDVEGGDISDANLKKYFKAGQKWYATHRDEPEVRAALRI